MKHLKNLNFVDLKDRLEVGVLMVIFFASLYGVNP